MISLGADVEARDSAGDTVLHHAARHSADRAIWHILKTGTNPTPENRAEFNPYEVGKYTWKCDIPIGILLNNLDLDDDSLSNVRWSEECCHGQMAILTVGGREVMVCPIPWCLEMRDISDLTMEEAAAGTE